MADTVATVTLTINGREVTVPKGTTVLEAAKSVGIEIPTFCWHPKLKPVGACRICYVEIEKMPKLQVSCATEAMPGMVVNTESEKVKQGRKAVLEFILINHPLDCPTCDKGGECDLQDNTFAHGVDDSRFDFSKYRFIRDRKSTFDDYRIGPEIIRNQNRCILCFKCVRANKEVFGEYDLGVFQRGNISEIDAAPGEKVDSIYSGNLVEICPVGALTNTDWRYKIRVWKTQQVKSVCSYCADGCNLTLWKERDKVYRATSRRNDAIDEGWICDVGRYGYQIAAAEGRLMTPLIKKGDKQVAATWDEAIGLIARKFREIKDKKGGVCIGGLISPQQNCETLVAFSKFFRTQLHSNNIDFRAEYKMLPEKESPYYSKLTSARFRIADIEKSDMILVVGSNLIKEHPIVHIRVRKAVSQKGAKLYTINPFATKSGDISQDEMIHIPGTLEALLNGLCISIAERAAKETKVPSGELKSKLEPNTVTKAVEICGIPETRLHDMAEALRNAKNVSIIAGELVSGSPAREAIAAAIHNLAIVLNLKGRGQAAILSRAANSKGAELLGVMPSLSKELQEKLKSLWGAIPETEGRATDRMIYAAKKEELDALLIIGANPVASFPDGQFVREGLDKLDFTVVADLYETETTEKADVVLPLSSWVEQSGHFINLEGTMQHFDAAIKPVGNSRPGRQIIEEIAQEFKGALFTDVKDLEREMLELLRTESLPTVSDALAEVKFVEEKIEKDFPYALFVVDEMHHFGHLTERTRSLAAFAAEAQAEIAPSLAEKMQIENGSLVRLESETGKMVLPAKVSEMLDNDVILVSRNFSGTAANILQMRKKRIDRVRLIRVEEK
ncbi:MAG: NADH-quinone oxidoreductase subunit NuoG [bacterium]|jgi:NADH-quinone oxidoreductase chain G